MVKMACEACAKALRFQEKYLGRKIHCPHCGHPQILADGDGLAELPSNDSANGESTDDAPIEKRKSPPVRGVETPTAGVLRGASTHVGGKFLGPAELPDEIGRLGGYRVLSQLGAGGMGVVFLAEDVRLKRKIALKVLPPSSFNDPLARERFYREARAAAALEHENIVTIHQVSEDRGVPFLAMPLLKGRTLEQELRERSSRRLPIDEVVQIAREIASGLAAAHAKGLVHRDIKPANLWLEDLQGRSSSGRRFRVKILDFGLARPMNKKSHLTETGIVVGTPSYMSPEQARGPNVDARSDLFSLGAVLYEISTGQRPFAGNDAMAVLSSLAVDVPLPPAEIQDDVPEDLSHLITDLLEKNPAHRPEDAAEVVDRLAVFESPSMESQPTIRLPSGFLRRRDGDGSVPVWLWTIPVAVVAFSLALIGWWTLRSPVGALPIDIKGGGNLAPKPKFDGGFGDPKDFDPKDFDPKLGPPDGKWKKEPLDDGFEKKKKKKEDWDGFEKKGPPPLPPGEFERLPPPEPPPPPPPKKKGGKDGPPIGN